MEASLMHTEMSRRDGVICKTGPQNSKKQVGCVGWADWHYLWLSHVLFSEGTVLKQKLTFKT